MHIISVLLLLLVVLDLCLCESCDIIMRKFMDICICVNYSSMALVFLPKNITWTQTQWHDAYIHMYIRIRILIPTKFA